MSKHSIEFKLLVVRHYLSKIEGCRKTATRFGIDHSTVRQWSAAYELHGVQGLSKPYTEYPTQFKVSVIEKMASESLSARQACAIFNIPTRNTILTWQRLYDEGGIQALAASGPRGKPKSMPDKLKYSKPTGKPVVELTPEEMRKELQYLRAENAYLKKLEALIQAKTSAPKKMR